jgi:hypothetical protein
MPEFMFRNLSVKLYPAGEASPAGASQHAAFNLVLGCCDCSTPGSYIPVFCGPDSRIQQCGQASTWFCDGASNPGSNMINCINPTYICPGLSNNKSFVDPQTIVVIPPGLDVRAELAGLKADLERKMAAVDARQREVENAAKPASVAQIDDLKSQLLAAVAELDDQRARMEGGGQAPPAS